MYTCVKCWSKTAELHGEVLEGVSFPVDGLVFGACCFDSESVKYRTVEISSPEFATKALQRLLEAAAQLMSKYQGEGDWEKVDLLKDDILRGALARDMLGG